MKSNSKLRFGQISIGSVLRIMFLIGLSGFFLTCEDFGPSPPETQIDLDGITFIVKCIKPRSIAVKCYAGALNANESIKVLYRIGGVYPYTPKDGHASALILTVDNRSNGDTLVDTITDLEEKSLYYLSCFKIDSRGEWNLLYRPDSVETIDETSPSNILRLHAYAKTEETILIEWNSSPSRDCDSIVLMVDTTGYVQSPMDRVNEKLVLSNENNDILLSYLNEKTKYYITIFTRDTSGNWSERCTTSVLTKDGTQPASPAHIAFIDTTGSTVTVSWVRCEATDLMSYGIYWNNTASLDSTAKWHWVPSAESTFVMNGMSQMRKYYVWVCSLDSSNNISQPLIDSVMIADTTNLSPLNGFRCAYERSKNLACLYWDSSSRNKDDSVSIAWRKDGSCFNPGDTGVNKIVPIAAESTVISIPYLATGTLFCISAFVKNANNSWSVSTHASISVFLDTLTSVSVRVDTVRQSIHDTLYDSLTIVHTETTTIVKTDTLVIVDYDTLKINVHVPIHDTTRIVIRDTTVIHDTDTVMAPVFDNVPPLNVRNLVVTWFDNSSITLNWTPSTSSDAKFTVISYRQDGECVGGVTDAVALHRIKDRQIDSDTIRNLQDNKEYCFTIFVQDSIGNWSVGADSARARISLLDRTKPHNITNLTVKLVSPTSVILSWLPSISKDADSISICFGTAGYPSSHSYYSASYHLSNALQQLSIKGLTEKSVYYFGAFAKDTVGNWSDPWASAQIHIITGDVTPPLNVTGFTASALADGRIVVHGAKSISDDADSITIRYRVDGQYPTSNSGQIALNVPNRNFQDTLEGFNEKSILYFSTFTKDSSGNWSASVNSAQDTTRTPDRTPPANITDLIAVFDEDKCFLSWSPSVSTDAESLMIRYRTDGIFPSSEIDGFLLHYKPVPFITDSMVGLDAVSSYRFAAFVKDSAGLWSTATASSRCILNRPPKANAGVDRTFSMVTVNTIQLDGSLSSDPEHRTLTYHWIGAESNPASVNIQSINRPVVNLTIPGKYVFILTVSDGVLTSSPDQCVITFVVPQVVVSPSLPSGGGYIVCRTIQEGIDSAHAGDTVFITSGTYQENVDVRKNNIFIYSSDTNTIVDGRNLGTGIAFLGSSNVILKNLKIIHGGRTDNQEIDVGGVTCSSATNITIDGCVLAENNGDGIRLWVSSGISIQNSRIVSNDWNGIRVTSTSFSVTGSKFEYNNTRDETASTSNISLEMRLGEQTKYSVNVVNNVFKSRQGGHHLGVYGPYILNISNNSFQNDVSIKMIGEAVRSTGGSHCQFNMSGNRFVNNTSITSILCDDAEKVVISQDTLDCSGTGPDLKGYDFVNSCQGSSGAGSEIRSSIIIGYNIGARFNDSPLDVVNNTFRNCGTGINFVGSQTYAPTLSGNSFPGCADEIDP